MVTRFATVVQTKGASCKPGANLPLHQLRLLDPQLRLPISEAIGRRTFFCPWFKKSGLKRFRSTCVPIARWRRVPSYGLPTTPVIPQRREATHPREGRASEISS